MDQTRLAFLLHWYQPPFQKKDIIARIVQECYMPLVAGMEKHATVRMTWNMSGCLLELFSNQGYDDLIKRISILVSRGQVELTGSSAYHAFLPRLPEVQIERQIRLQEEQMHALIGTSVCLKGFFSPEMAYTHQVGACIRSAGYRWTMLDERAKGGVPKKSVYQNSQGLLFPLRQRDLSYAFSARRIESVQGFARIIADVEGAKKNTTLYMALDAETFGHHHLQYEQLLFKILTDKRWVSNTVSESLDLDLKATYPRFVPRRSSWTILDKKRSIEKPFLRWSDETNEIHKMQWQLTRMACEARHTEKSHRMLDKGLFSCQYWWACAKPWWQVEMIESGAHELLRSIIWSSSTATFKKKATRIYHDILATSFEWMRSGKMQRRVDREHEHLHYKDTTQAPNI